VILFSSHGIVGIFRKGGGTGWLASNFTSFFLPDPMMLQLYTLCFPLIHWRHFFETTKIKLSRTNNNKNIKEHNKKNVEKKRKSGAIGKPEKQATTSKEAAEAAQGADKVR